MHQLNVLASEMTASGHSRRFNLGNAGCPVLPVEGIGLDVIQAPKPEASNQCDTNWGALSACRGPIWQARGKINGLHQVRFNPHLAAYW
jgi:hypothetical protein